MTNNLILKEKLARFQINLNFFHIRWLYWKCLHVIIYRSQRKAHKPSLLEGLETKQYFMSL